MQLAEAFQFCPRCGRVLESAGRNPLHCTACGFTFYFSPVAAVVCLIANDRGEILMLVRARDPGRGMYGLPGGFVDPGESIEAAAVREVREEVRLEVTAIRYLGSFANAYDFRGVIIPVTDVILQCEVAAWDALQADPREVERIHLRRPGPAELRQMAFDSNRRGLELCLKRLGESEHQTPGPP